MQKEQGRMITIGLTTVISSTGTILFNGFCSYYFDKLLTGAFVGVCVGLTVYLAIQIKESILRARNLRFSIDRQSAVTRLSREYWEHKLKDGVSWSENEKSPSITFHLGRDLYPFDISKYTYLDQAVSCAKCDGPVTEKEGKVYCRKCDACISSRRLSDIANEVKEELNNDIQLYYQKHILETPNEQASLS